MHCCAWLANAATCPLFSNTRLIRHRYHTNNYLPTVYHTHSNFFLFFLIILLIQSKGEKSEWQENQQENWARGHSKTVRTNKGEECSWNVHFTYLIGPEGSLKKFEILFLNVPHPPRQIVHQSLVIQPFSLLKQYFNGPIAIFSYSNPARDQLWNFL